MNRHASLEGDERLRLFFGLPIPPLPADQIAAWARASFGRLGGVRSIPASDLHVTLAFLGTRSAEELDALREALDEAAVSVERPVLSVARYRESRTVSMLVLADGDGRAGRLQARLADVLARSDLYRPESRPWLAHLTVARFRTRPRAAVSLPAVGPISPSEAALYHSTLRPSGAQYEIVYSVPLDD